MGTLDYQSLPPFFLLVVLVLGLGEGVIHALLAINVRIGVDGHDRIDNAWRCQRSLRRGKSVVALLELLPDLHKVRDDVLAGGTAVLILDELDRRQGQLGLFLGCQAGVVG